MNASVEVKMPHVIHNIQSVRKLSGDSLFMAVVKSNAYGLGMLDFSLYIQSSVDRFGVNSVEEAFELLDYGITKPIHILAPYFNECVREGMIPTIDRISNLYRYNSICEKKGYHGRFHLKVNTGMNRFGLEIEQVEQFLEALQACSHITMEGVFSHFGSTYGKHKRFIQKQWDKFMACKEIISKSYHQPIVYHIANSAACIDFPESRLDMVRIGNAMYGFQSAKTNIGLLPTYHVKASVLSVRFVNKGENVGYGYTFKAGRNMWVAVISFGGYDGFGWTRKKKSILHEVYHYLFRKPKLFIQNQGIQTLGNISMNYILADVSSLNVKVGDEVMIKVDSILSLKREHQTKLYRELLMEDRKMSIDLICTIGPASASYANLKELILRGMSIARLNMSHGNHASHKEVMQFLREASRELGTSIRIMADLQGPKIRLGEFEDDGVILEEGQSYDLLTTQVIGNDQRANVDYSGITKDISIGATVLINDGEVKLEVKEVSSEWLKTTCLIGGKISSHKGVNFPGTTLNIQAITDKDREDLAFLLAEGVDLIACSFIRRSAHLEEIREVCRSLSDKVPQLIAKIETLESVKNFKEIAAHAEGIMIARGDLGVELPFEQVPLIQKTLLKECKASGTYVITATHMLQSMIDHPVPTRAEVTDIFQAVLDGTNAVMLSAESSIGKFPLESVQVLSRVALFAECISQEENDTLESLYSRSPFV